MTDWLDQLTMLVASDDRFFDWDRLDGDELESAWGALSGFVDWLRSREVEIPGCWYLHADLTSYLQALALSYVRLSVGWERFSTAEATDFWRRCFDEWPRIFQRQLVSCKRSHSSAGGSKHDPLGFPDHVSEAVSRRRAAAQGVPS